MALINAAPLVLLPPAIRDVNPPIGIAKQGPSSPLATGVGALDAFRAQHQKYPPDYSTGNQKPVSGSLGNNSAGFDRSAVPTADFPGSSLYFVHNRD